MPLAFSVHFCKISSRSIHEAGILGLTQSPERRPGWCKLPGYVTCAIVCCPGLKRTMDGMHFLGTEEQWPLLYTMPFQQSPSFLPVLIHKNVNVGTQCALLAWSGLLSPDVTQPKLGLASLRWRLGALPHPSLCLPSLFQTCLVCNSGCSAFHRVRSL